MSYRIEEALIPSGQGIRCPKKYMVLTPRGMCWHWTGNTKPTASARNHYLLWHRAEYGAQYVVDDHDILHTAPDNELIWHAGPGSDYTEFILQKYPQGANSALIGVELCVNSDGDWEETYKRAVWLGAVKCIEYGWNPFNDFVRHYDCTKKDCPRMFTPYVPGGAEAWQRFLRDVAEEIKLQTKEMVDVAIEKWQEDIGQAAVDALSSSGLLNKPEDWKAKVAENTPNWLFFEMLRRLNERIEKSK